MSYDLDLPESFDSRHWKVKIRGRERLEPPHATVIFKTRTWRYALRSGEFLDSEPPPREVPDELIDVIEANLDELCQKWNEMYPENPV